MFVQPSIDLDALIRTLLGIQATLVAGSITGAIYLLVRWREARTTLRKAINIHEDKAVVERELGQLKAIEIRALRAKVFVSIVPLVTVMETLFYYLEPSKIYGLLVVGILALYVLQVLYLVFVIGPPSLILRLHVSRED